MTATDGVDLLLSVKKESLGGQVFLIVVIGRVAG